MPVLVQLAVCINESCVIFGINKDQESPMRFAGLGIMLYNGNDVANARFARFVSKVLITVML